MTSRYTCIRAFGALKPGDQIELPDDVGVSPLHFARAPEPEPKPASKSKKITEGEEA